MGLTLGFFIAGTPFPCLALTAHTQLIGSGKTIFISSTPSLSFRPTSSLARHDFDCSPGDDDGNRSRPETNRSHPYQPSSGTHHLWSKRWMDSETFRMLQRILVRPPFSSASSPLEPLPHSSNTISRGCEPGSPYRCERGGRWRTPLAGDHRHDRA
jgi:hypothetical protein